VEGEGKRVEGEAVGLCVKSKRFYRKAGDVESTEIRIVRKENALYAESSGGDNTVR
jgi:hypothetical protein